MALGVGGAIATLCALMLQGEKGDESKGAGDWDRTGDVQPGTVKFIRSQVSQSLRVFDFGKARTK